MLFRKKQNSSSSYNPDRHQVRRDGVYIYEEFLSTFGTDVKVRGMHRQRLREIFCRAGEEVLRRLVFSGVHGRASVCACGGAQEPKRRRSRLSFCGRWVACL